MRSLMQEGEPGQGIGLSDDGIPMDADKAFTTEDTESTEGITNFCEVSLSAGRFDIPKGCQPFDIGVLHSVCSATVCRAARGLRPGLSWCLEARGKLVLCSSGSRAALC